MSDSVECGSCVRWQAELGQGCSGVVREIECEPREKDVEGCRPCQG